MVTEELDFSLCSTTAAPQQEPLTLEKMMQTFQELREQYPEPPVEILSPAEYWRRTGFRLPLSEETLAAIAPPPAPLFDRLKYELLYGASFMRIKDFYLPYRVPEGGTGAVSLEKARQMIEELEELKAQYASETSWTISPKARHQLLCLAARKRREHRAWLRTKRQRRARQRRHQRGLS